MTRVQLGPVPASRLLSAARVFDDARYVLGGNTTTAVDCSGLVHHAGRLAGAPAWPRTSGTLAALAQRTHPLTMKQGLATAGALLWRTGHVGLSVGDGWQDLAARGPGIVTGLGRAAWGGYTHAGLLPGVTYELRDYVPVLLGSAGPVVERVQQALRDAGFKGANGRALVVDGDFGTQTEAAVLAFQKRQRLVRDGVAGPITQAALGL